MKYSFKTYIHYNGKKAVSMKLDDVRQHVQAAELDASRLEASGNRELAALRRQDATALRLWSNREGRQVG